jgi:hypothetical protein
MQQTGHLLYFRARSYDQFGGLLSRPQKTPQMLHQDDLSPVVISAHFYTYLGGMFLVYIPMYYTI